MKMNDTWGWSHDDQNWKSPAVLVRNLVEIVSKGGNYLLNVGPQPDGAIPRASIERLAAIGAWMERHAESIHGCGATPFTRAPWFCTTKPGRLYVHLFERPADGRVELVGLRNAVKQARWLGDEARTALPVGRSERGPIIELPAALPDPIDSVLVVEIEGNAAADPIPLRPDADGVMRLHAADADVRGGHARFERDKQCIGYWTDAKDQVQWEFELPAAQRMRVVLDVACPGDSAGSKFAVRVGANELRGEIPATGAWTTFRELALGELELPAGTVQLAIVPLQKPGLAVMNLRGVRLEPVR
jgi:alpha-L-fucosidase